MAKNEQSVALRAVWEEWKKRPDTRSAVAQAIGFLYIGLRLKDAAELIQLPSGKSITYDSLKHALGDFREDVGAKTIFALAPLVCEGSGLHELILGTLMTDAPALFYVVTMATHQAPKHLGERIVQILECVTEEYRFLFGPSWREPFI